MNLVRHLMRNMSEITIHSHDLKLYLYRKITVVLLNISFNQINSVRTIALNNYSVIMSVYYLYKSVFVFHRM